MKVIDRLYEYFNFKGIKPTAFEKELGLSNGYLGTQKKRNADMGESIIMRIIDYCRDISIEWLLTGQGQMLRDERPAITIEPTIIYKSDPKDAKIIALQEEKIKILEEKLSMHSMGLSSAPAADIPSVGGNQTSPK